MSFACSLGGRHRACVAVRRSSVALAVALLASTGAHAQSTPATASVLVTATRLPERVGSALAEVSVIDRAQLDASSGRTLSEVLSSLPGLQFSSNGGLGKSASVFVRGLEARHTLLLIDGVRVGSASLGTPSLDNLPLDTVERIEVVRGPMSALYGNDAAGGVIQVVTQRGRPGLQPVVRAIAGSNGHGQLAAGLGFGQGAFDGNLQLQSTQTDGFSATNPRAPFGNYNPDRDGFRQQGGSLRLGWQLQPDWRLETLALSATGRSGYDDGLGADAQARLTNTVQSLQLTGKPLGDWQTELRLSRSSDGYDTLASASPYATLGEISTTQRQIGWENRLATPVGTALMVLERLTQSVDRPGTPFTLSERSINALGIGLNGQAGGHRWQAALREDHNSQYGHQTTGQAAYAYQWAPAWRAGLSHGTSFNAPSFNQLYYPGFGNPKLQPERGEQTEAHLRWAEGAHSLRATVYDYRIRGYISSGPLPVNVPRTRIDGMTLAYEGQWQAFRFTGSLDHLNPRNASTGTANNGKLLARRAQDMAKAQVDWTQGPWTLGSTLAAYGHRFDDAANATRLGGYATPDLHADYAVARDWTVGARVNNLADHVYETALGYTQPRRQGFVTLRWQPK